MGAWRAGTAVGTAAGTAAGAAVGAAVGAAAGAAAGTEAGASAPLVWTWRESSLAYTELGLQLRRTLWWLTC